MLSDDRQLIETPISDETVFRGALIDVSHMQVRLPNGRTALRESVHHKGAAAIVPVDDEEYVYLVRQHRVVNDMLTWEIPAGKLDHPGEDHTEAALRELHEETGYRTPALTPIGELATSPAILTEIIYMYLAENLEPGETDPDDDEFLELVEIPLEELVGMILAGEIQDSKTQAAVLKVYLMKQREQEAGR